jgi:ribosomal protein S18 acetylase RimI-like enzyme
MGVGSRLLIEVCRQATRQGYQRVRLDVIDTNPKARKLYERLGFQQIRTERFPYLKNFLGFGGVTTMELTLTDCRFPSDPSSQRN